MKHKWHKEIKAWADGAEIEMKMKDGNWINIKDYWEDIESPIWYENEEYRIKPQPKEPQYLYVYKDEFGDYFLDVEKRSREIRYKIKLEIEE